MKKKVWVKPHKKTFTYRTAKGKSVKRKETVGGHYRNI